MDAEDAPRTFFARYAALPMLVLYNVHLVPALARLIVSEAGRMHEGADLVSPKIVIMGSSVRLPELETVAERNSNVRMFRMRTLSQGEITGGGHDFLERLRLLDFPSVVSYNESNRDLILSQAMRGGYPSGRDGTPDERHDFFHDLIREICRLDLPSVSPLKNPLSLRKVYRMVGAVSGESVNLTHIAEVLGIGRPFAKHCLETLERLCLVDRIAVWPGSLAFERGVRSPKYVRSRFRLAVRSAWLLQHRALRYFKRSSGGCPQAAYDLDLGSIGNSHGQCSGFAPLAFCSANGAEHRPDSGRRQNGVAHSLPGLNQGKRHGKRFRGFGEIQRTCQKL